MIVEAIIYTAYAAFVFITGVTLLVGFIWVNDKLFDYFERRKK